MTWKIILPVEALVRQSYIPIPQDEPRHPGGVEESVDETWVHTWSRGFVMAEGLSRDNSIMVMVAIGVFWSMTGILLSGDIYSNV